MELYPHQKAELEATKDLHRVAYYHDMGLGKTFTGSEKMSQLGAKVSLIICQKSKVDDWMKHVITYYDKRFRYHIFDLTYDKDFADFFNSMYNGCPRVGIINYELAFRRPELLTLKDFTLMLDESSLIQNETAKRTKFIMKMKFQNLILLSGTPTSGKYENLWSQLHLLGWKISKDLYWRQYIDTEVIDNEGFPIKVVTGYKNVDRLKAKMRQYGCRFLKTEDVFDLPEQNFESIFSPRTKEYAKFRNTGIVQINDETIVGDTTLTKMLYERQLCGQYNPYKLIAVRDLLQSSDDRIIIFYNFTEELLKLKDICITLGRPVSIVNGQTKDLSCYEQYGNSITLIQYQAGAMGLNLQKANKIVYFTPPLSSELFEQSKKRTHRIGQNRTCFYYQMVCQGSVEEKIYATLEMRKDYTDVLFEEDNICVAIAESSGV